LLTALYAISECNQIFVIAVLLSISSIVGTFLLQAYPSHGMVIASHTSLIALLTLFSVAILGHVVRSGRVTSDKIFAAICEVQSVRIRLSRQIAEKRKMKSEYDGREFV